MKKEECGREYDTLEEVMERLGGIPLHRVRIVPPIGTATEKDLRNARDPFAKLLELVDGTLVEKAVTTAGSVLASAISFHLCTHVKEHDLGILLGETCPFLLKPGLVRKPHVAFVPWERIPGEKLDLEEHFARFAPELVVELTTPDTTQAEMARRLREYFEAGARLAWVIDLSARTAKVHTSPETFRAVGKAGSLSAAPVFPGLALSMPELFSHFRRKRTG